MRLGGCASQTPILHYSVFMDPFSSPMLLILTWVTWLLIHDLLMYYMLVCRNLLLLRWAVNWKRVFQDHKKGVFKFLLITINYFCILKILFLTTQLFKFIFGDSPNICSPTFCFYLNCQLIWRLYDLVKKVERGTEWGTERLPPQKLRKISIFNFFGINFMNKV